MVSAFSSAASQLALAVVTGADLAAALAAVKAALQANTEVQAAVEVSVGAAVSQFLGISRCGRRWMPGHGVGDGVVRRYDGAGRVQVQVAALVSGLLGGGPLGAAVGGRSGPRWRGLMADSAVSAGGGVDGHPGRGFLPGSGGGFGVLLGGQPVGVGGGDRGGSGGGVGGGEGGVGPTPRCRRRWRFRWGGGVAVPGDQPLWAAVDACHGGLVTGLFADTTVQDAVQVQVAALVSGCWVGPLGAAVGGIGAAVAG